MQYLWTQSPGKCPPIKEWRWFLPPIPADHSHLLHDAGLSFLAVCLNTANVTRSDGTLCAKAARFGQLSLKRP